MGMGRYVGFRHILRFNLACVTMLTVRSSCCIDKNSLTELSESINSMFRWYRDAAICYAYLSDVDDENSLSDLNFQFEPNYRRGDNSPGSDKVNLLEMHALRVAFSKSRWFERGWTLQELIAPDRVVFFAKYWCRLGSKEVLSALIESITGIDKSVLLPAEDRTALSSISIAARMSWAARRRTTRLEDRAYCLLGIFDVNMPLLYGEGNRAFLRLQEEIMKTHGDQSLFAWGIVEGETPSMMDLHMPHPTIHLKPSEILIDNISDFFATSPAEFEASDKVGSLDEFDNVKFGVEWKSDYLLPPMLMSGGLRIQLPVLCLEDLERSKSESYEGRLLCQLAYQKSLVVFAVLNCSISNDTSTRLAIPLIAWDMEHFGRCGKPVLLHTYDYRDELEERNKTLFIKAPPKPTNRKLSDHNKWWDEARAAREPTPDDLRVHIGRSI